MLVCLLWAAVVYLPSPFQRSIVWGLLEERRAFAAGAEALKVLVEPLSPRGSVAQGQLARFWLSERPFLEAQFLTVTLLA